ncbi:MAG: sigma-70 family RNA polymerase sigma factor [Polyangiaceae bacterium]
MSQTTHLSTETARQFAPMIRRAALRIARRLPSHVVLDDLMSAGYVGLLDAHRRFDPALCDRFEPYAELRIRGAMLDEVRCTHDTLSRDLRQLATRAAATRRRLETALGRHPADAEVAAALGIPCEAFHAHEARIAAAQGAGAPEEASCVADAAPSAEVRMMHAETRRALRRAITLLPERMRGVVELYFIEELTLREIGARLGVTESRVSQLVSESLQRLRAQFALSDPDARHLRSRAPLRRRSTQVRAQRQALPLAS